MTDANDFIRKGQEAQKLAIKQAKEAVPVLENLRSFFYHSQHEKYMSDADNMIQFLNDLKEL